MKHTRTLTPQLLIQQFQPSIPSSITTQPAGCPQSSFKMAAARNVFAHNCWHTNYNILRAGWLSKLLSIPRLQLLLIITPPLMMGVISKSFIKLPLVQNARMLTISIRCQPLRLAFTSEVVSHSEHHYLRDPCSHRESTHVLTSVQLLAFSETSLALFHLVFKYRFSLQLQVSSSNIELCCQQYFLEPIDFTFQNI